MAEVSVHPSRITAALDNAELWGPEVDVALGGVEPMVDEWEAGVRAPTPEQVVRLAALTGMQVGWFYRGPVAPHGPGWICQRSGPGKGCTPIGRTDEPEQLTLDGGRG
jgi:hypothetical protein